MVTCEELVSVRRWLLQQHEQEQKTARATTLIGTERPLESMANNLVFLLSSAYFRPSSSLADSAWMKPLSSDTVKTNKANGSPLGLYT